MDFFKKKEDKKVEYVELIYDLIFVYMIGRNNQLLEHIENGFIAPRVFIIYLLCTIITIQIWYLTAMFINKYGTNGVQEHIMLFVNMFLLYYMANGTTVYGWQSGRFYYQYNIAWMLILLNIAGAYGWKLRIISKEMPWGVAHIRTTMKVLIQMAAIVLIGLPVYYFTHIPLTPVAMIYSLVHSLHHDCRRNLVAVDFMHLSERIMLYVVFTFGEMIVTIADYFKGGFGLRSFYFALMTFLVVVGLFLSYGFLYDHIIDRERQQGESRYMMIHVFLIFALSNITVALSFMRESAVAAIPKSVYMTISVAVYYICLYLILTYSKGKTFSGRTYLRYMMPPLLAYMILQVFVYQSAAISVACTVILVFVNMRMISLYWQNFIVNREGVAAPPDARDAY